MIPDLDLVDVVVIHFCESGLDRLARNFFLSQCDSLVNGNGDLFLQPLIVSCTGSERSEENIDAKDGEDVFYVVPPSYSRASFLAPS